MTLNCSLPALSRRAWKRKTVGSVYPDVYEPHGNTKRNDAAWFWVVGQYDVEAAFRRHLEM
jgi:hypothetical protein